METATALYGACVMGAIGVWLLLRRPNRPLIAAGTVACLAALGWLIAQVTHLYSAGEGERPEPFFLLFGVIALGSALRMVTSARPVYCALYFVLVVLASAGLFLLMEAEFMAFALVIVYAGAILITYLFVLMLAQQAPTEGQGYTQAEYDLTPREPAAAVLVGFVLLAVLGEMLGRGPTGLPGRQSIDAAAATAWRDAEFMPQRLEESVKAAFPTLTWPPVQDTDGRYLTIVGQNAMVRGHERDQSELREFTLPPEALPQNVQRVGLALVKKFPVSLELAGVILLMAMFGAVVLARRQIDLGEDEKRAAAGMRRLMPTGSESEGRLP